MRIPPRLPGTREPDLWANAGGGYRHQGHVAYNRRDNTPLSNLFVRMMQQTGVETRSFGSRKGVLGEV